MTARSPGDRRVLDAIERWLGADLFDGGSATAYLTAFDAVTAASLGSLPGDADRAAIGWGAFEAYLDGYATHVLRSLLPGHAPRPTVRPRPSAADPPGFVSSEMAAAVPINTASVEELREVPGIGARLANRIVENRERFGPFARVGRLARVPGFSRASYEAAARHLTARSGQPAIVHRELANRSSIGFPAYVRFLHRGDMVLPGRESPAGSLRLPALAVREMSLAAAEARSAPYWQQHRNADPTSVRLRRQDLERDRSVVRADGRQTVCKVAPVTNDRYLPVLRGLIESSTGSIRISMHLMRLGTSKLTGAVLEPLVAARARTMDVRILLDRERGTPGDADRRALARLLESGIPVHHAVGDATMHRKAIVFDHRSLLIGSHNLTPNSIFRSEELSLFVQNAELAKSEAAHFDDLWRASEPVQGGAAPERAAGGAKA